MDVQALRTVVAVRISECGGKPNAKFDRFAITTLPKGGWYDTAARVCLMENQP